MAARAACSTAPYASLKRESLLRTGCAASPSARAADWLSRVSSISSAAWALSFPMRSKFSKLIFAADDEDLLPCQNAPQERLSGSKLLPEFQRGVEIRVDLAAQELLRRRERADDIGETGLGYDHEIQVAAGALLAAGDRTVDEGNRDLSGERRERFAQHVRHAHRLLQDAAQLLVDRAGAVRLKVDLVTNWLAYQHASRGERFELPQQRSGWLVQRARDLAHV